MPLPQLLAIAGAAGVVLYVMLDSGVVRAETPKVMSVTLVVLALIFALGSWTASFGDPRRRALLAGLSIGLVGYAILRLLVF